MGTYNFQHASYTDIQSEEYLVRFKTEEEQGKMPFLTLPFYEDLCKELDALKPYLNKFKHMLLLGIGGSALGARALQKAFAPSQDRPMHTGKSLWIMDNIDPISFNDIFLRLPKEETLVVTISKSGGTIETLSQYFLVKEAFQKHSPENWQEHFIHITDKNKGFLREEAKKFNIKTLEVPDNLGGRFSVLSAVGMLPAAFLGIDYKSIMKGALDIGRGIVKNPSTLQDTDAWKFANFSYNALMKGYSQVIFFVYHPAWATFGAWFMQLWAESLGKHGKGSMPISALGVTDQHSLLQMFLDGQKDKTCLFITSDVDLSLLKLPKDLPVDWEYIAGKPLGEILNAESLATRMALVENKVPLVHAHYPKADCYEAGQLILTLELATLLTGWFLGVNPIDQPAVEQGKILANAKLGNSKFAEYLEKLNKFEQIK